MIQVALNNLSTVLYAVIERPDGTTYTQAYDGTPDGIKELKRLIGDDYLIVAIYGESY